jgi:hypothetical protein
MRLIAGWRQIIKKAWSVRLITVAGLLSGLELVLPMYGAELPRKWYATATIVVTTLALVARLVAQKGLDDETAD